MVKGEKREARNSSKNANHTSRSGTVSRDKANKNDNPNTQGAEYHKAFMATGRRTTVTIS